MKTEQGLPTELSLLEDKLKSHGVDLSVWGQGNAKHPQDLLLEIQRGETNLVVSEKGILERVTRPVAVQVRYESPTGDKFMLREDRSEYLDGRPPRRRKLDGSVAGLVQTTDNKDSLSAAKRELKEELGDKLGEDEAINPEYLRTNDRTSNSPSYPGLLTRYVVDIFTMSLTHEQFDPNGYVEPPEDPELPGAYTTYFVWEKVENFD